MAWAKAINYLEQRISRPDGTDCWIWQRGLFPNGYGHAKLDRVEWYAHRLAYTAYRGPIPDGKYVLHSCDERRCVNPDHLRVGTHQDNMDDRGDRNRTAAGDRHYSRTNPERLARGDRNGARRHPEKWKRGEEHWSKREPERSAASLAQWRAEHPDLQRRGVAINRAKLNDDIVREIRRLYSGGMTQVELAKRFDVFQTTISQIVRWKTWAHVK